jgi:hypothetical protein
MLQSFMRYAFVGLLALPVVAFGQNTQKKTITPAPPAQYEPPRQAAPVYTPPPRNEPRETPQPPRYTPPQRTETPRPANNAPVNTTPRQVPNSSANPTPNAPSRPPLSPGTTYTPRAGGTAPTPPPKPVTTYTPRSATSAGTPGGSQPSSPSGAKNGAVTYTPRAGSSLTPPSASDKPAVRTDNGVTTYTPRSSPQAPVGRPASASPASAATTYSVSPSVTPPTPDKPTVRTDNGVTTYTPRSSPAAPIGRPVSALPASPATSYSVRPPATPPVARIAEPRTIQQINTARATMHGVNQRPLPLGVITNHSDGGLTVKAAGGKEYAVRANGTIRGYSNGTQTVNFRSNGKVAAIHRPEIDIRRGAAGQRTVVSRRADKSVLVSSAPHHGYLERTVTSGNRAIIQRSYFASGRAFTRAYLGYSYAGLMLPHYVPGSYYPAEFYGWAYYGWAAPVAYAWGWTGEPWYGFYDGYLTPYTAYPSGFAWLTDFVLAQTLADAYADRMQQVQNPDDASANSDAVGADDTLYAPADSPITPELKDQIAGEVQHQLAYESAVVSGAAQPSVGEFPASLKSSNRVFVVASILDVATPDQQACALTPGDVLRLEATPPEASATADLRVASSHRQDCPSGIVVTISLLDLQEMQNSLRTQLDAGLQALHTGQGHGGLPPAPVSSMGPTQAGSLGAPEPDPNVAALLDTQQQEAARTEMAAMQEVFPPKQQ